MLQQIRDRTTGLIAGFIVAIVVIPFAFFGIDSFSGGSDAETTVAKVGDEEVTSAMLQRAYDQRYQQLAALMGDSFRPDQIDATRLRAAVLRDLTQEMMLRQHADSEGYLADDATLFRAISRDSAFQRDGAFNADAYREVLASAGYTPERYEAQLRNALALEQMRDAVVDTAFVVDPELDQTLRLAGETRELEYAVFDAQRYRDQVTVGEDEIQARYDQTRASYQAPERIRLAYVELSREKLQIVAPEDDVLKALYEAEKSSRFTTQEERHAAHILIGFGTDKDAARAKAESLAKQLAEGADFAALAREQSEDPGSKDAGGDLGWIKRGQMTQAFEDALFGLDAGKTSAPVETEFGYHLIRVLEIKPPTVRAFDDPTVREELVELFSNRERQQRFEDMSAQLEQLAFENPASLQPVADALGLTVQTTDWIVRGESAKDANGLAANPAIVEAAFSPEVRVNDENSKPLTYGDDALVVIRKDAYEAARPLELAEVSERIRDELTGEKVRARVSQEAEETVNAALAGTAFQGIVSAKGGELRNPGEIRRDDKTVESAVLLEAFRLPRPAPDKPSYGIATLADGSKAVLRLSAVRQPETQTASDRDRGRAPLKQTVAGAEFSGYLKAIESAVGVELMQEQTVQEPPAVE